MPLEDIRGEDPDAERVTVVATLLGIEDRLGRRGDHAERRSSSNWPCGTAAMIR